MISFRLSRRALLRGAAGAVVPLPWLNIMSPAREAHAAAMAPKRYLIAYCGVSIGGDEDKRPGELVPTIVGPNYDLKTALAPLEPAGAQPYVSVISGLRIPEDEDSPGGLMRGHFHGAIQSPLLTGVRNGFVQGDGQNGDFVAGTSSDQIVADAIGKGLRYSYLPLRVQASNYGNGAYRAHDSLSFRKENGSQARKLGMQSSPKAAYDSMFTNFNPDAGPEMVSGSDLAWRKRKSVLDFVRESTRRLGARLGAADKQRLDQHLTEIDEIGRQLATAPKFEKTAACRKLDPFEPPAAVDASGYSGEDQRAKMMCDLMHIAFACDQARVGTLMFTFAQSFMSMKTLLGYNSSLHQMSHFGAGADTTHKVCKGIAWHMKHFGYLVKKLADTPDAGGAVIDNCALVFTFEGGQGPAGNVPGAKLSSHSGENMACLVAGKAGGLKAGQHIVARGLHPANVLVTCMNAVGVPTQALGAVSGEIPGLR